MKVLMINCCAECPFFNIIESRCEEWSMIADYRKVENRNVIPEWCKLKDF